MTQSMREFRMGPPMHPELGKPTGRRGSTSSKPSSWCQCCLLTAFGYLTRLVLWGTNCLWSSAPSLWLHSFTLHVEFPRSLNSRPHTRRPSLNLHWLNTLEAAVEVARGNKKERAGKKVHKEHIVNTVSCGILVVMICFNYRTNRGGS